MKLKSVSNEVLYKIVNHMHTQTYAKTDVWGHIMNQTVVKVSEGGIHEVYINVWDHVTEKINETQ